MKPGDLSQTHPLPLKKKERPNELVPLVNYLGDEVARIKKELQMEDEEAGWEEIGKDTFSFFLLSTYPCPFKQDESAENSPKKDKFFLPFWWASLVLLTQVFVYSVVLASSSANFLNDIPLGVTKTIRAVQFFALFITLLTQNDFADGVKLFISREAFYEEIPFWKFYTSTGLRFFTGILGIYTIFLLVVRSDDAVDLLLNFSAMAFVSELDGVGYALAKSGFLGSILRDKADEVDGHKYLRNKSGSKGKRLFLKYMPYAVVAIFLLGAFSAVWAKQNNRNFEENMVYVQFDDQSWSKLPQFSGIYEGQKFRPKDKKVGRIKYVKSGANVQTDPGFVYCRERGETSGSWKFDDKGETDNPCEGIKVTSVVDGDGAKKSDEYNLLNHASADWIYESPRRASKMTVTITEASNLKEAYKSVSDTPCGILYSREGENIIFFNKLNSTLSETELLAQRPLFKADGETDEGEILHTYVVFNGYRWLSTHWIADEYSEPSQILSVLGPDEVYAVSDPFGFLTSQDTYLPTGNFLWHPPVGFLPDLKRSYPDQIFTSCLTGECGVGQTSVGIEYVTDNFPAEVFFTMFLDSFTELISVSGSTTFDFNQAKAFRGGPYPEPGELFSLYGCANTQDKINIGLFDTFGDGLAELVDPNDADSIGGLAIYVDAELAFNLHEDLFPGAANKAFTCLMLELDVATGTVLNTGGTVNPDTNVRECDAEQQKLMEDTLIDY